MLDFPAKDPLSSTLCLAKAEKEATREMYRGGS